MARITHARFTLSPFTSEQMERIGNATLDSVKARIARAETVDEQPAKPLSPVKYIDKTKRKGQLALFESYATQKQRRGALPQRDLRLTGALMQSVQVVSASEDRCIIASNNIVKDAILHRNNQRSSMFGMSESDKLAMQKAVRVELEKAIQIVTKT